MKIIFYSTNSNQSDSSLFKIDVLQKNDDFFLQFKQKYHKHDFICVTQEPKMFMPETLSVIVPKSCDYKEFAKRIIDLKPDIAIAMTFWVNPYDWLTINDALVGELLASAGIKTFCHSVETGLICFDKYRTRHALEKLAIDIPRGIFVDHDMYFCAGSHKEVVHNVYRESVFSQMKKLRLPIVIKDTSGLSSYGMTVVNTYGEFANYLNSKRNNSNRIAEEFIKGQQFGVEIYGIPGNYTVMPMFLFSVNQYGITSPKQSVKFGSFCVPKKLKEMLLKIAVTLDFSGCAQIDLVFGEDGKWYVIEINPRLSGMSYTYSVLLNKSIFEMLYLSCVENEKIDFSKSKWFSEDGKLPKIINLKLPLIETNAMQKIIKIKGIKFLNQTNDLAAKQEREKGFCECIISGKDNEELLETVQKLRIIFPEDSIVQLAESMLKHARH